MSKKIIVLLFFTFLFFGCTKSDPEKTKITIRAWHFPDIVHSAAMVGKARGIFEQKIGCDADIDWKIFNAGPSAIEALYANEIDIGYIGPNPAINGYIRSRGKALKIVCGASSGGAGLVVRVNSGISRIKDFKGKKIATPQLGNTQDVACRAWLKENGFEVKEKGGTVEVIPIRNPDQLTLFLKNEIDGAWTKEPWVARLIKEGNGKLFLDERENWPDGKFVTAQVIVRSEFLKHYPALVKKWIEAHVQATEWINKNIEDAKKIVIGGIASITGKALPEDIIDNAFSRTTITYDPVKNSLLISAENAYKSGFLGKEKPDLSKIYDLSLLNKVLKSRGLKPID